MPHAKLESMENLSSKSNSQQEEKIERATNEIIKALSNFEENEVNLIMQKVKLHHLELKVASFEVSRLLKSVLQ